MKHSGFAREMGMTYRGKGGREHENIRNSITLIER